MDVYDRYQDPVVALCPVPKNKTSSYGVVKAKTIGERIVEVSGFVEKPAPKVAPSNLAVVGRYIITPEIFDILERTQPDKGGEIRLAGAFAEFLKRRSMYGCIFDGTWYDCGSKLGFLKAQTMFGLSHAQVGKDFKKYLRDIKY
jgi:UTP--glucose-1-phosphate uridylyltransferase